MQSQNQSQQQRQQQDEKSQSVRKESVRSNSIVTLKVQVQPRETIPKMEDVNIKSIKQKEYQVEMNRSECMMRGGSPREEPLIVRNPFKHKTEVVMPTSPSHFQNYLSTLDHHSHLAPPLTQKFKFEDCQTGLDYQSIKQQQQQQLDQKESKLEEQKSFRFQLEQQVLNSPCPLTTRAHSWKMLLLIGLVSLTLAIALQVTNKSLQSLELEYPSKCSPSCQVTFTITHSWQQANLFYILTNFHQNHRKYLKSKDTLQLKGQTRDKNSLHMTCGSYLTNQEIGKTHSYTGHPLQPTAPAEPCGLMPASMFNDTFTLHHAHSHEQVFIDQSNLALPLDKGRVFKRGPTAAQTAWVDVENQHFMVWMRPSVFNRVKKLWGRVAYLSPGDYYINIQANYPPALFNGNKYLILQTVNAFGANHFHTSILFIVQASICFALVLLSFYPNYNSLSKNQFKLCN